MGRLDGQVALITGGSRGIGAAAAQAMAAEGAAVAIAHEATAEMSDLAQALVNRLKHQGMRALALPGDLADEEAPARLVQLTREAFGAVSVVVANAATMPRAPFNEIDVRSWDRVQAVNARSTWLLATAAREDLIERRGCIIAVSSVMARTGQPGALHYTASKAAIIGMTRALARELGPHLVRVNAVVPGAIRTEHETTLGDPAAVDVEVLPMQALPRRGTAADLAGIFVFLASAEASFITGQSVHVDGGWIMH